MSYTPLATGTNWRKLSDLVDDGPPEGDSGLRRVKGPALRFARFMLLLWKESWLDRIFERSAALTYTTILSLFPALVVVTAIASVFYTKAQENQLIDFIEARMMPSGEITTLAPGEHDKSAQREAAVTKLTDSIRSGSKSFRASAGNVGLLGFLGLLIAAGLLFQSIERSFDAVWKVTRPRPWTRTLGNFATLILLGPIVVGLSISASSFAVKVVSQRSHLAAQAKSGRFFEAVGDLWKAEQGETETSSTLPAAAPKKPLPVPKEGGLLGMVFTFIPPMLNGLFLALAYMLMPQAKVQYKWALVGGMVGGILWELAKVVFFFYAVSSVARRELVKAMGVVPLFLIWIYFSWLVVLIGAEISYVAQNFARLARETWGSRGTTVLDGRLLLAVMMMVTADFAAGRGATSRNTLRERLDLSDSELEQALKFLMSKGLLQRTETLAYLPGKPADTIGVREVLALGCDPAVLAARSRRSEVMGVADALQVVQRRILDAQGTTTLAQLMATPDAQPVPGTTTPGAGD